MEAVKALDAVAAMEVVETGISRVTRAVLEYACHVWFTNVIQSELMWKWDYPL